MDTHDNSASKSLAEVRIHVRSEDTPTTKAFYDGHNMSISNQSNNKARHEVTPTVKVNKDSRPLFEAVVKSDWKAAEKILDGYRGEVRMDEVMTVGNKSVNVLEFAVMAAKDQYQFQLVEKLVDRLDPTYKGLTYTKLLLENLTYKESILRTGLYDAARRERIMMVKTLVKKVKTLMKKLGSETNIINNALSYAISNAPMQKEVIWHLAKRTTSAPDFNTMSCLILAGHLDIGLFLAHKYPKEVTSKDNNNRSLLGDLVKMKSYFLSGDRLNFWEKCVYKCIPLYLVDASFDNPGDTKMARALKWFKISLWNYATKPAPFIKRIGESKLRDKCSLEFANQALTMKKENMESTEVFKFLLTSGIVLDSASHGTHAIVKLCLDYFPELMWDNNFPKELMKEVVNGRQVELFRLVNAYNIIPKLSDDIFTNRELMEAVVKWSPGCVPANVPGAAFLMQRELQWFKVLEDRSDPSFKTLKFKVLEDRGHLSFKSLKLEETKERGGKTYWEVFVEQRQDLLKEAGQWMKDTSSSCSLIATLIITVAFTAVFTVPGGNDDKTGFPIFQKKVSFMVFTSANALALFSSVTATVMFLAVVTPCYTVKDILYSLPRKMIMGITFLFLSLAFMLVAFGSALMIVLSEHFKWIYIPIILFAAVPVCFFLYAQFPLYVEMVNSIYRPRLYRPMKLRKKRGWVFNSSPKVKGS